MLLYTPYEVVPASVSCTEKQYTGVKTDRPVLNKLMNLLSEGDTLVVSRIGLQEIQ